MRLKHKIRLTFFPILASLANKLGVSWQKMYPKFRQETLIAQLKAFQKKRISIQKNDKPLTILFTSYLGGIENHLTRHYSIAKALQAKGHKIQFLLADIVLPIDEYTDVFSHHDRDNIADYLTQYGIKLYKSTGFEIIRLTDLVPPKKIDQLKLLSKGNQKWDDYVEGSIMRYLKLGVFDRDSNIVKDLIERGRHAAFISEELGHQIVKLNPDRIVNTHGAYTTKGPAKDLIVEAGIPLVSQGWGKMARTQRFSWGASGDMWIADKAWENMKHKALTTQQKEVIDDYLLSRRGHKRDAYVYNLSPETSRNEVYEKINLDRDKKTYTLFTNLIWDAASAKREIAFESAPEWIYQTIMWFKDNPDKQLIIKPHPAERVMGTNQTIESLIKLKFPQMPENVRLVSAADVNSWSLINITDVGMIHTSTVGLELAIEGVPCICVSDTFYRNKGFTLDVSTKKEYFDILSNDSLSFDKENCKILARRYSYLIFLRSQIPMPFYLPEVGYGAKYMKGNDITDTINAYTMKVVAEAIENKEEVLLSDEYVYELYGKKNNKLDF